MNNPRDRRMELRMTGAEMEMLSVCAKELGKTRSDTVREAIVQMYMYLRTNDPEEAR